MEMGIGEAFGVKIEKLELKGTYTVEELFDQIKDVEFEAGKPELVKHGFSTLIVFPQLDNNNQVWIIPGGKGKFTVQRSSQPAGVGNVVKNMALDQLTDGWSGMSAAFGSTKKRCIELTEKTAQTINALGL